MEENKNINPETQSEEVGTAKPVKEKKAKKINKKPKLIRNQALFKRGGYSVAITALVLVGLVVINVLLFALSNRFNLQFDMSAQKINSIDEQNIKFIEKVEQEVEIIVCANRQEYSVYMASEAQRLHDVQNNGADKYYNQTLNLIDRYHAYNKKIKISYVDTQSTEFAGIAQKYSNENLAYGDIIVVSKQGEKERYKIVGYKDIYELTVDETYAAYGITSNNVSGNNIETALTSAISYVTSNTVKTVAFLAGHSKEDVTAEYRKMLEENNYVVDVINDFIVNEIPNKYDAIFIVAPTIDFKENELNAISDFLQNDGKLNKGLVFFANARAPYLTNLYDFLRQWGINVGEGILFETSDRFHIVDTPTTMMSGVVTDDEIVNGMQYALTGNNVPLTLAFESENNIETKILFSTSNTVVNAPAGTSDSWTGADKYNKSIYATVAQSLKGAYDEENNFIKSVIYAFSSVEFINSPYSEYADIANKNMTFVAAEDAVRAEDTGVSFVSKKITEESFADSVTESSTTVVRIIFMVVLPVLAIALGIYVYIKRRNA